MQKITYTNKNWQKEIAKAMPERCPKCNSTKNFKMIETEPTGNLQLGNTIYIKCSEEKCNFKKDITPYDLW
jgi:hypothetical protein